MDSMIHCRWLPLMLTLLIIACGRQGGSEFQPGTGEVGIPVPEGKHEIDALLRKAEEFHHAGEFMSAIEAYSEALRSDPADASVYFARGSSWLAAERLDEAIADFTAAIRLSPNRSFYYGSRAAAYYGKKDYDRAIADSTLAIGLAEDLEAEDRARLFYCRAMAHQAKGNLEAAEADFKSGRELDHAGRLDPRPE